MTRVLINFLLFGLMLILSAVLWENRHMALISAAGLFLAGYLFNHFIRHVDQFFSREKTTLSRKFPG